jgi:hypothetical protein
LWRGGSFSAPGYAGFSEGDGRGRSATILRTLSGVENIPGTDQVSKILDGIEPKEMFGAFDRVREILKESGAPGSYRVPEGTIPVAPGGTWYYSSKEISCGHCLKMQVKKRGEEEALYYHEMARALIVKPGKPVAGLPLIPEFVRNEDGNEKQYRGRDAAKRWIGAHKGWEMIPRVTGRNMRGKYFVISIF